MHIETHRVKDHTVAEMISTDVIISTADDSLSLLGDLYYQGYDAMIVHAENITPRFFDLKNGIAGEMLQKFSNYRIRLAIVGDFSSYTAKSIRDFIMESNKTGQVCFVDSVTEALGKLFNK
jgi:hypothetical protein